MDQKGSELEVIELSNIVCGTDAFNRNRSIGR